MKTYILVGKSGVGKSSFINASFGVNLARCDPYEPCTTLTTTYAESTEYGPLCLIDTPGFADDCRQTDLKYLEKIERVLEKIETCTVLYLSRIDDKRFRGEDKEVIRLITEKLGHRIWRDSWLVLTFCAEVPADKLDEISNHRIHEVEEYIRTLHGRSGFNGFQRYILIDNVKENWAPGAPVITSTLCRA